MTLTDDQKGWIEDSAKACGKERINWERNGYLLDIWQPHIPAPAGAWDREQICRACELDFERSNITQDESFVGYLDALGDYKTIHFTDPQSEAWAVCRAGAEVWRARKETKK